MKQKKLILLLLGAMIIGSFLFVPDVKAASADNVHYSIEAPDASGDGTGVTALDGGLKRGENLIVVILQELGFIVTIIGIALAGFGWLGHQEDMKAKSPVFIGVGLVVYFASEIAKHLLGR